MKTGTAVSGTLVWLDKQEYEELLEDHKFLYALRAAGVDNWDGYDYAQEMMED